MTEQEWLKSTDPQAMLSFLHDSGKLPERKARLFAVAVCRRIWPLLDDERSRQAVEAAESFADGLVDDFNRSNARKEAQQAAGSREAHSSFRPPKWKRRAASAAYWAVARHAVDAVRQTPALAVAALIAEEESRTSCDWRSLQQKEQSSQATLIRDIHGNLFRPLPALATTWLEWNDGMVKRLAEAAYDQRTLPGGALDLERLAVLGDALEEAGADAVLLEHLRAPGQHIRGCWSIDLLLGKE